MNLQEITKAMGELDNWGLTSNSITKEFKFENFSGSLNFVNKVGEISNSLDHHPDITIRYDIVVLSLTTHSSDGLTEKDFEVAKEIDSLTNS